MATAGKNWIILIEDLFQSRCDKGDICIEQSFFCAEKASRGTQLSLSVPYEINYQKNKANTYKSRAGHSFIDLTPPVSIKALKTFSLSSRRETPPIYLKPRDPPLSF